jgi:Flp pilus assembly protein TadG
MIRRLDHALRRFGRAAEGNIAVTFAIALLPILGFIGAAIDYSRANLARSSMQAALDSTALMVAKDLSSGLISTSDISTKANGYFAALYTSKEAQLIKDSNGQAVTATYNAVNGSLGSTVQLNVSGDIRTDFKYMFGFPTMNFNTSSTTAWGNARLRVAMVLDNTGSMAQDGKMTALHNAATQSGGLIDQLAALSKNDGDVYISVIPFAKAVNVNNTNYGASWLDWTDWVNPPTAQPNNGVYQATLPLNWHAVGPGSRCPFNNTTGNTNGNANGGFVCKSSPTASDSSTVSTIQSTTISINGASVKNPICPTTDSNSHTSYNGCWTSEPTGSTEIFCSGSSNCKCPKDSSGNSVSGCSCTGSGSGKFCTGLTYVHNWTQPGPNDTTHNPGQPRVSAAVGFKDMSHSPNTAHIWTPTATTVANDWRQASTNPISTWTGCVADRTQPNDATTVSPSSGDVTTQFPANQYFENNAAYCAPNASTPLEPVIPLTSDWSALKTAINAMQPTGGTNQAIGLSVGAQTLIPGGAMFNAPAEDPNYTYNRAIILLSDGLNTEDRWPEYGDGSTQNTGSGNSQFPGLIDARQAQLCDALKASDANGRPKYTIYTVQVNTHTPADPTSAVLQYCASTPDKFFMLTSSSQILTAFKSIGTSLAQLRVAR